MKLQSVLWCLTAFIQCNYFEIHRVVVCINSSFLFDLMAMPQLLTYLPNDDHLGHSQVLVITDKAAVNVALCKPVWTSAFLSLRYRPKN